MNEFQQELKKNIRKEIARLRRDQVVGMSIPNLIQITKTPSPYLQGAPSGPAGYQQVFRRVLESMTIKNFNIYEGV